MKKIGFVGLGTMGYPMAQNLLKHGYTVIAYNRTSTKSETLAKDGAVIGSTPADVARQSDVVFTMLTADAAVESVILGENGILAGASSGLIVIDSSTISPNTSQRVAKHLAERGVHFLDAPVTGSEPQAQQGVLTFMAGGDPSIFEQCRPLFDAMGKNAYYMGSHGAGSYTKLANNAMAAINMAAFAESVTLAVKSGVDPDMFLQVVSGGGARSGMAENKGPKIVNRDFHPNFAASLMYKDLTLASQLSDSLQFPHPLLSLTKDLLQMTIAKGYGQEDVCAIVRNYEDWAGVQVTAQK